MAYTLSQIWGGKASADSIRTNADVSAAHRKYYMLFATQPKHLARPQEAIVQLLGIPLQETRLP